MSASSLPLAVALAFVATTSAVGARASMRVSVRLPNGAQAPASTQLAAPLEAFAFLLGEWTAVPGAAGETGGFVFTSDVQGRVIRRTNHASYPAVQGRPASRHDDLMVMAVDNDVVRA